MYWSSEVCSSDLVYLLGSFHMLSADDYPLAQVVETAYAQADRLVFEISPNLADSPGMGAQMVQRAMLPAGTELADVLSKDTLTKQIGRASCWESVCQYH